MNNKRQYPRYKADITLEFQYTGGDHARGDAKFVPAKGIARILNISLGGVCMQSDLNLKEDTPISIFFNLHKNDSSSEKMVYISNGTIIRTEHMKDKQKKSRNKTKTHHKKDNYFIAVKFNEPQFVLSSLLANLNE